MLLGYLRVSTADQNPARQIVALKEKGVADENIYCDKASGKNTNREQLTALLRFARKGDTIITESISRIARNTADLLRITADLNNRGIEFISLKENIDTSTPQGRFVLTVFGALAELERENTLQRQREGIAIAKSKGVYKGKPKMKIDKAEFEAIVKRWRDGELTATRAMELLNLKPNTFYRRVKEWGL